MTVHQLNLIPPADQVLEQILTRNPKSETIIATSCNRLLRYREFFFATQRDATDAQQGSGPELIAGGVCEDLAEQLTFGDGFGVEIVGSRFETFGEELFVQKQLAVVDLFELADGLLLVREPKCLASTARRQKHVNCLVSQTTNSEPQTLFLLSLLEGKTEKLVPRSRSQTTSLILFPHATSPVLFALCRAW